MKRVATGVLTAVFCCVASVSFAESLVVTARKPVPPPGLAHSSNHRTVAHTAVRNKADVYASVNAGDAEPTPWIDDTSVRLPRHRLR